MLDSLMIVAVTAIAAAALLIVVVARRPDRFEIVRSTMVAAGPDRIFPLIDDLRAFNGWNPFVKRDPDITGAYAGPPAGQGARYEFAGRKSGTGCVEITDSTPGRAVGIRLLMVKPLKCDNRIDFTLEPSSGGTRVSWAMSGPQTLMGKCIGLIIDMDKMVGGDFERGLADLEALAEKR